jgi:hypothetical protein
MDVHVPLRRCVAQNPRIGGHQNRIELTRRRDEQSIDRVGECLSRDLTAIQYNIEREFGEPDSNRVERVSDPSFGSSREAEATERVERNDLEHAHRRHANSAARLGRGQQVTAPSSQALFVPLDGPDPDVRIEQQHASRD